MSNILYEKKDKIVTITLNRPEMRNAVDEETYTELSNGLIKFRDDKDAWVAIITGAGDKAFSAGADLTKFAIPLPALPPSIMRGLDIWKPLIAAVNGIAYGGGMELVLSCDLVIAAQNATFGVPEVRWGLIPGWGGTQRLPRILPRAKASEMLLMGVIISAEEALNIGLVNKVVALPDLLKTAEDWAQRISENAPLAVRAAKEAMLTGLDKPLEEGLRKEWTLESHLVESEDVKEGLKAFREKRKPIYKGY